MSMIGNQVVSTDFPTDYGSGNGSTTAFTLSIAPASVNAIAVTISGVKQSPKTYTVSGTTLTFSAAPPTGTDNIVIEHKGVAGIPNVPSAGSVVATSIADGTITAAKFASGQTPSFNGITFPATQSASTDANTLDDYEEGTWTPTITANGGSGSPTYLSQVGTYTKIGRSVTIYCNVSWAKNTLSGGYIRLNGLPFTMPSPNDIATTIGRWYLPSGTAFVNMWFYGNGNTTAGDIYALATANVDSAGTGLAVSQTGTNSYMQFTLTYNTTT